MSCIFFLLETLHYCLYLSWDSSWSPGQSWIHCRSEGGLELLNLLLPCPKYYGCRHKAATSGHFCYLLISQEVRNADHQLFIFASWIVTSSSLNARVVLNCAYVSLLCSKQQWKIFISLPDSPGYAKSEMRYLFNTVKGHQQHIHNAYGQWSLQSHWSYPEFQMADCWG